MFTVEDKEKTQTTKSNDFTIWVLRVDRKLDSF